MRTVFRQIKGTLVAAALGVLTVLLSGADEKAAGGDLVVRLRAWNGNVFPTDGAQSKQLSRMLAEDARARLQAANQRESQAWNEVKTRADWEKFRDLRLQALRESLGPFPPVPKDLKARVTGQRDGDGYRVENVVFESRPGLLVTANLYRPADPPKSIPGILIAHSHHNPKTQGELQDMGMTWARQGCLVLVPDHLGHGERRQHPFVTADDYPGSFRPGRQDYYFRYNTALQLHLAGESLIGWMVWDLMRGVDLLLAQPGIDKERIVLLGAVAGGGDPAAVTAALDPRIAAVAPFNFGGPQPETTYPLPPGAERTFNYAGGGSWESTRNLRLSARDGFLPWVIVGGAAPRRLSYAHEFAWDREHDPVWARLEKVYGFYGAGDRLDSLHGRGAVTGTPPESTHCNNIGPEHRRQIYPALKRWFGMEPPEKEFTQRRPAEELACLTPAFLSSLAKANDGAKRTRPVHELAAALAAERSATYRKKLADLGTEARRRQLRQDWTRLLGAVDPETDPKATGQSKERLGDVTAERITLEVAPRIVVPLVLLSPSRKEDAKLPVVVGFAQEGKQAFLQHRPEVLAELLNGGTAVCLPDLRGTGETRPGGDRGRQSAATSISATELMLGQTLVGSRLRDLRAVLRYLRTRTDLDATRLALWGDSFAPVNPKDRKPAVPLDADKLPAQTEPLGGLLALFGALFEDDVRAAYVRGGLAGFDSVLQSPFCYVPHDAVPPGALTAGDLCDVAAALAPRPVRLEGLVDGLNRGVPSDVLAKTYEPTRTAYRGASAKDRFLIVGDGEKAASTARWLLTALKGD
jgi:dienelactone hydrolase